MSETIAIGERGGLPTQVTHHKIIGRTNWGKSVETLKAVDEARARGVDVTIDQYPYTASSTEHSDALLLRPGRSRAAAGRCWSGWPTREQRARIGRIVREILRDDRGGGDPKNV